jgi:NADH:flavin oxidoreductase / NADH oxidase family
MPAPAKNDGPVRRLFEPIKLGRYELPHRIAMAPLTRSRALQPGSAPLQFYAPSDQRGFLGMPDLLLVLAVLVLRRYVLVNPIQDNVRDLKIVRTQHHHVGCAIEDRIPQFVQLDILGLRQRLLGTLHSSLCSLP